MEENITIQSPLRVAIRAGVCLKALQAVLNEHRFVLDYNELESKFMFLPTEYTSAGDCAQARAALASADVEMP